MRNRSEVRIHGSSDWHIGSSYAKDGVLKEGLQEANSKADILLLAGDITHEGTKEQAIRAANILKHATVPLFAVTGNHDIRGDAKLLEKILTEEGGVTLLHGEVYTKNIRGIVFSITGTMGWFEHYAKGNRASTKEGWLVQKYRHREEVRRLARGLAQQQQEEADIKVVLEHFVPSQSCVVGAKDRNMRSDKLGYLIDSTPDISFVAFGHEHSGMLKGTTRGGVPAYNLAMLLLQRNIETTSEKPIVFRRIPIETSLSSSKVA